MSALPMSALFSSSTPQGVVKSVQRGLISLLNAAVRVSTTISPVDRSKSELRMLGSMVKGDVGKDRANVYILLEGVDKVTAVRNSGMTNDELVVSFEITEYY